jgi:hypothetical protein
MEMSVVQHQCCDCNILGDMKSTAAAQLKERPGSTTPSMHGSVNNLMAHLAHLRAPSAENIFILLYIQAQHSYTSTFK